MSKRFFIIALVLFIFNSLSLANGNTKSPTLLYNTHNFDPAGEDDDGFAEGGETIVMPVNIFNSGTSTATNISVVLSTSDPDIIISSANTTFANIESDGNIWGNSGFIFDISSDCEEHDVEFNLQITSNEGVWNSSFFVHVFASPPLSEPFLLYNTHAYDPAGEDDDGIPEGGESIGMPIQIFNSGTQTATNITAVLTTLDPDITIIDAEESYPNIHSDSAKWCLGTFGFNIDIGCEEHEVEFVLEMTSDEGVWTSTFTVHIFSYTGPTPNLLYNSHVFNPAGEDDDGIAEGGETIIMPVNIYNSGIITATNITAVLSTTDPDITIINNEDTFINIDTDEDGWGNEGFQFDIAQDVEEHYVEFILNMTSDEGTWTSTLFVHVYPPNTTLPPILLYNTHDYTPAGEDDDGLPEPGETIVMPIQLYNSGLGTATNISAILTTTDPDISINISENSFPTILSDSAKWSLNAYEFEIAQDCQERDVSFVLEISANEAVWTSNFTIHVFPANTNLPPDLLYNTHSFDPAGEDDDNLPEVGESIIIPINIYNSGEPASNITAILRSFDDDIIITDSIKSFDDVMTDGTKWSNGGYGFDISPNCEEGDKQLLLEITSNLGIMVSEFSVRIYPENHISFVVLAYNEHKFFPAGEDDDGFPEGGESIVMPVNILNSGTDPATNISATLSTNDPDITITDANETFDNIGYGDHIWSDYDFNFDIAENCLEHDVELEMVITSNEGQWTNSFLVHIYPKNWSAATELIQSINIAYPNPNDGNFRLQSPSINGPFTYQVFDITGKEVFTGEMNLENNKIVEINFSDLNTGIYFLKLNNNIEIYIQKIIIQ